nr:NEDD4-binding protein 2-like 2 isoform X2 [Anolis sagrei ordinatus]
MLHAARRPRYFDNRDVSATESSSKRVKPSEEPYGKSYEGLQILHEEIHVKKTHSGFIPLSLYDDEAQEEKETTDILFNKTFSGNKTVSSKHLESMKNTEVSGNKYGLSNNTSAIHNGENIGFSGKHKNKGETELYSTSTAFIGPIYKNEDGRQHDKKKKHTDSNCQKVSGALSNGHYNKEMTPKYVHSCDAPKIEDELSQFYSEIDQLESNDNCLDSHVQATVTNLNEQPAECNKSIQVVCASSREWSCRTSPNWGDGQCFYKEPSTYATGNEPYPYYNHISSRNSSGQCCNNERDVCETEPLCNKQESSIFWNDSVPHFKPSWQPTAPFIVPCGPSPPQFATQFNLQETSSSPFHSHIFHSSNVGPLKNTHITMSSSTPDQSNEFVNRFGTHNMQTARNGYNMSDGHVVNGFCETQGSWKDFKMCQNEGSSIVSQQIPETKFCESQKLLFILRGLPGSGKTTLSHILLRKSRDGIVFSTDDYFRQNNGCWSYNIALLGNAHDWNQKRAKEAMDHGRSPIIIDNTNTQAWEMKPYVEAALEKGYRVEFHEPDTWWKFNPEELEKRNEHGVSREKIVQMLERYEYQMSIPIVMNSVLPFHKTSQRPPPQRRQRELDIKKNDKLHKMKQRRKQKRNQKMKGAAIKSMGEKSNRQLTSSDEDSSQSGYEDSEGSRKPAFVSEHSNESKEGGENGSANNDVKLSMLKKESILLSSFEHPLTSGNSPDPDVLAGNSSLPVASLPAVLKEHIIGQSLGDHVSNRTQSSISEESRSNMPEYNHPSCSLKLDHNGTDNSIGLTNMKGKDGPTNSVVGLTLESKQFSDKEEATILHHYNASQRNETNTFFSFDMVAKKPNANSDKSEFSRNWLEDTSKIIYDQRPKKVRKPKKSFSETTAELLDHGSSKEFTENKNDEVLDGNSITGGPVPSLLSKNTWEMPCTIIDYFAIGSGTNGSGTSDVTTLTSPNKKGRSKRIFKLAPKFDVPRQIPIRKEEKMVKEVDVLLKEEISNEDTGENSKQSLGPPSSDSVVDVSQFNVEYLSCNNSKELVKQSVDSPANAAPVQMCPLSFEALLPSEQSMIEANTEKEGDKVLPEVSTTQPDILYSVKDLSECLTRSSAETLENTQLHETGLTVASQIKDNQDPLSAESSFLGLPLSLAFAAQLVELFGSPGVSLGTLLPDDYVVPLEWETSKEIYLQWKMSVEKKQKNNILKEEGSLTGDLEESNKDGERDNSSEDNQKISLPETLF